RDLGRRGGAMKDLHLTVPATAGWGSGLARVPEGADVDLDLRLESVVEGVLVSGIARAHVDAECARCLEPVAWDECADIQELFVYPPQDARGHRVATDDESDAEDAPPTIEDDLIDLEATVRDAVVLRLPIAPLCRDDCPGLCAQCGAQLALDPGHRHEESDPRWAALGALLQDGPHDKPVRGDAHDEDKDA
ncbi:MAG: YceD family protein, partial [Candidatus Nanopelagicales bacterium]